MILELFMHLCPDQVLRFMVCSGIYRSCKTIAFPDVLSGKESVNIDLNDLPVKLL